MLTSIPLTWTTVFNLILIETVWEVLTLLITCKNILKSGKYYDFILYLMSDSYHKIWFWQKKALAHIY